MRADPWAEIKKRQSGPNKLNRKLVMRSPDSGFRVSKRSAEGTSIDT
jgi:hypothetical protein